MQTKLFAIKVAVIIAKVLEIASKSDFTVSIEQ